MSKHTSLSAFTSDLTRNPDLYEAIRFEAAKHGFVTETVHGDVTTFTARRTPRSATSLKASRMARRAA